jgi:hypothetical protein
MVSGARQTDFLRFFTFFVAGSIPESLGNLQKLKRLELLPNQFSGSVFACFDWVGLCMAT